MLVMHGVIALSVQIIIVTIYNTNNMDVHVIEVHAKKVSDAAINCLPARETKKTEATINSPPCLMQGRRSIFDMWGGGGDLVARQHQLRTCAHREVSEAGKFCIFATGIVQFGEFF